MTTIQTWNRAWCADIDTSFVLASYSLFSQGINRGAPDVYGPQAQVWQCSIAVATDERRTATGGWQKIGSFFTRSAGQKGLIRMFDPKRIRPGRDIRGPTERAALANTPFSDGTLFTDGTGFEDTTLPPYCTVYEAADAGADSIIVTGLPVSTDACLWAGDRCEHLPNGSPREYSLYYEIGFDAPTDSLGRTRLAISPTLRIGVAAGDQIRLDHASGVFRLTSEDQGGIEHSGGGMGRTAFQMIEVLQS